MGVFNSTVASVLPVYASDHISAYELASTSKAAREAEAEKTLINFDSPVVKKFLGSIPKVLKLPNGSYAVATAEGVVISEGDNFVISDEDITVSDSDRYSITPRTGSSRFKPH